MGLEKKHIAPAEAIPENKYGRRPAEKVCSVSEVFMHVAGANYGRPQFTGVKAPDGFPPDIEKITAKSDVMKHLKASFGHVKDAVMKMPDADMEKTAGIFEKYRTYREIGFFMVVHLPEHIGQLIANVRTNGIAPPRSSGWRIGHRISWIADLESRT